MFFIRTVIVVAVGIMLMPLEETQQASPLHQGSARVASVQTFCERHPATCAAGGELWGTFKKKAEVALVVAVKMAVEYARQGHERSPVVAADHAGSAPSAAAPAAVPRGTSPPREVGPATTRSATARSAT